MLEPASQITAAVVFMSSLGVALALILAIANRRLYVYEDPRINKVEDMLPHSNCGACGKAGCRAFAEALILGNAKPGQCTVNPTETNEFIAQFLGVDLGGDEKRVARLACAGGNHVAWARAHYDGLPTCRAASLVSGGGKGCAWGCLGLGDCESVCEFDALKMDEHGIPQVKADLCTACGDCVDVCPKNLFSLQPISRQLWIACKNLEHGDLAEFQCDVACNGCGKCVMDAADGLIYLQDNLAHIDYSKNVFASRFPTERCPTGAIVWIAQVKTQVKAQVKVRVRKGMVKDNHNEILIKGKDAKPVVRRKPLPVTV